MLLMWTRRVCARARSSQLKNQRSTYAVENCGRIGGEKGGAEGGAWVAVGAEDEGGGKVVDRGIEGTVFPAAPFVLKNIFGFVVGRAEEDSMMVEIDIVRCCRVVAEASSPPLAVAVLLLASSAVVVASSVGTTVRGTATGVETKLVVMAWPPRTPSPLPSSLLPIIFPPVVADVLMLVLVLLLLFSMTPPGDDGKGGGATVS